ncbi:hypothetical protein GCM10007111_16650 [Virgibacillus kapii]|uniref:Carboxylesterase type B domain-containing protein n=1 Tax=Virgibacillus kapii TaxID=1638645 RepID=A0ABQ2DEC2_9BACI|nr:hypothetical protein GCM10007111_16650 [Virgibacillus kapii]
MAKVRIETKSGKLRGYVEQGTRVWKGIPNAKPPVGELRFRSPAPLNHWEGELDATEYGPMCPQNPEVAASIGATGGPMSENFYMGTNERCR